MPPSACDLIFVLVLLLPSFPCSCLFSQPISPYCRVILETIQKSLKKLFSFLKQPKSFHYLQLRTDWQSAPLSSTQKMEGPIVFSGIVSHLDFNDPQGAQKFRLERILEMVLPSAYIKDSHFLQWKELDGRCKSSLSLAGLQGIGNISQFPGLYMCVCDCICI